ncbi:Cell division protein FtsQ [Zhongshania aliphaticivorans]|uniref:Cell division protein FtsQ n=1 Tax=Zhongshania aliphaticivorans TaxID=1470434 RepID=A0A5S9N272_9GAMM|nr:cell division protein FtsQ/DivIB [Zhongshania aliphaticivorans]CAA0083108.1 Cell division protein FtsQ [Zhongshania aliphaticivorans]CAA0083668.1 Cell division protein FtsQ [Zhongshania aliphaticivorans]
MRQISAKHNRFKRSRPERGERQPVSREWGRIFNRLLLVAVTMGFVYGVERLSSQLESIPVDRVVFAGDFRHVSREVLIDRVTSHLAVGYIGLDLEGIQSELEQEPWVYRAIVERVWPRELKITIVEETPIAVWGNGGLLNHRGKIFLPTKPLSEGANLPLLSGPEGGAIEIMRQYRLMSQLLGDENLILQRLRMNDRGAWTATLNGGTVLVLGRQEPLEKLRRFMWVYKQQLAANFDQVKKVDTRYINGLAVSWHELEGS